MSAPEQQEEKMIEELIGKVVIVRDNMAGVFVGTLAAVNLVAGTAVLNDARKIHYWRRAAATEGIAVRGIDTAQSRVTPAVPVVGVRSVVQIHPCDPDVGVALLAAPEWRP